MLKRRLLISLILLLIFLSLFPRSIDTLNGNPIFGFDQGRDYLAVKNILIDHKLTLIGAELGAGQAGLSYLFHGPGYFYLLAIPFIIFDGNPVGGVFLMLIIGLSAIIFAIYFISKFLGWKQGLFMGFLVALSPDLIGQSRFIENHFGTTLFILIVFYFVFLFSKLKQKWKSAFIFLAAFFSAFIYNLETAIAIPLCITLLAYCFFLFRKKVIFYLPYLFLGFILGFSPMILFESRHGFMGIRSVFSYLLTHNKESVYSVPILQQAKNIINLLILSFSDSFPARLILAGKIMIVGFSILAGYVFLKEKDQLKKNIIFFLILLFPVNFIVFLFLRNIIFEHYITDLVLAYLILLTYSLFWLYKNKYLKLAMGISLYLTLLVAIGTYSAVKTSMYDYRDYGGTYKLKGKIDAIDYIYKDANKKPFGLLVFTPTIYTYPYDYLLWWHGQRKYGYIPYKDKKGTFYLLIEKDVYKPWSYRGWEETIIKTGQIVYTKTLPSGFIVEKRIEEQTSEEIKAAEKN